MEAMHGMTGAAVLDASGALAWTGEQTRLGLRSTTFGALEVLPHNRAGAGEPDSRTQMMKDWMDEKLNTNLLIMQAISVLEHT
jgi:hypothetical protein